MDLPDVNVLLALLHPEHVHHRQAISWFVKTDRFATTPITETGFLRLSLRPRIVGGSYSAPQVIEMLGALHQDERAQFLSDDSRLVDPKIDTRGLIGHRQVTDMHLVNLAAAHGAVLVTFDRRIARSLLPHDAAHVRTL